eukprot:TRINITY_DN4331_c0_g1_i1.p1 TRINITY_DN4331_c0_g1~~TRINITY_DN4331_c0_g1_i1.p1  ORF type:complete len:325 (-),score=40.53 TRINITY_DN4331_c0_g1_i1:78-1052(-)
MPKDWWQWLKPWTWGVVDKPAAAQVTAKTPETLETCSDAKLLAELRKRQLVTDAAWAFSDRDALRFAWTYQLPLYLASFPSWYIEHPLFVTRMHMEYEGLGFAKAARRIIQQEGWIGFLAGSANYGLRTVLTEWRCPNINEIREKLVFSVAGLRLPVAFSASSLSIGALQASCPGQRDLRISWLSCFACGFGAALVSCPAESLMRQSTLSHADYVRGREHHEQFQQQPRYKRVFWKSIGLDPVQPRQYSAPAELVAKTDARTLLRGWPLHCTGFGLFFASFCCVYEAKTGSPPSSSWISGRWENVLETGSLAILAGSCAERLLI